VTYGTRDLLLPGATAPSRFQQWRFGFPPARCILGKKLLHALKEKNKLKKTKHDYLQTNTANQTNK